MVLTPSVVYKLKNKASGTYLDLDAGGRENGTKVQGWAAADAAYLSDQLWILLDQVEGAKLPAGVFQLMNARSSTYLELSQGGIINGKATNGTQAQAWELALPQYVDNQRWKITQRSDGYYQLQCVRSNLVLDLDSGKSANGTKVQGWQELNNNNQGWELIPFRGT